MSKTTGHLQALLLLCLLALSRHCPAEETIWQTGTVVKVIDGDSLEIRMTLGEVKEVRLANIDAPEWNQAGGAAARRNLADWLTGQSVQLQVLATDRYQRWVATVKTQPETCQRCPAETDVGVFQISTGNAWWYRQYAKSQGKQEQQRYEHAEQTAKENGIGLWQAPHPVPPWQWRQNSTRHK